MKHRLLVVTDHSTHSSANSLYEIAAALENDSRGYDVWVCSKGLAENQFFFAGKPKRTVLASEVRGNFSFDPDGSYIKETAQELPLSMIDSILVRMPQPLDRNFLLSLVNIVPRKKIINDPEGTIETSSKEFLMKLSHLCPSLKMCYSLEEAIELSHIHEIVLKPLYSYGGRGIVRLSTRYYWVGTQRFAIEEIYNLLPDEYFPMLAMRYLPNVSHGDKRTIIVNRQIMGSALRLPPANSWICNVAQGGHAVISEPDEAELKIEKELTPLLFQKGVVMYGFDTLVDDNGIRVLSEINTLSIGGLGPIEEMSGKPVLKHTAALLWDYLDGIS
jgi:glutathione synthase